jgi:hypothetical protein
MNPKSPNTMIAILVMMGGAAFGVLGGIHAVYTLLDLRHPRRLVPDDPSVAHAMANSTLRLSDGGTDMWRAWIGFNSSHSIGLLLVGAIAIWAGARVKTGPVLVMPLLAITGCVYLALALLYWFRVPAVGVAIGTCCFDIAWLLSLS